MMRRMISGLEWAWNHDVIFWLEVAALAVLLCAGLHGHGNVIVSKTLDLLEKGVLP